MSAKWVKGTDKKWDKCPICGALLEFRVVDHGEKYSDGSPVLYTVAERCPKGCYTKTFERG